MIIKIKRESINHNLKVHDAIPWLSVSCIARFYFFSVHFIKIAERGFLDLGNLLIFSIK